MVTFVYPNSTGQSQPKTNHLSVYLGIAYSSSVLKQARYKTSLIDTTWINIRNMDEIKKTVKDVILNAQPFLVAIWCVSFDFDLAIKISKIIKSLDNIPIVFGGPHPTISPHEVISVNSVDFVCLGEGEDTLLELANKLRENSDISNIKNLWIKNEGRIIKNEVRPLIEDLDALPFPDRDLFDRRHMLIYEPHIKHPIKIGNIQIGRGCPYHCSHCINHVFRRLYNDKGRLVHFRSPENIIAELKELIKKYSVQFIYFTDDTFTYNKELIKKLLRLYKDEINLPFTCLTRAETITKDIAFLLKSAGCRQVGIGIETGNVNRRYNLLKRKESRKAIINAVKFLKEAKVWTHAFNMIGLPYETEQSIIETIRLNKDADVDSVQIPYYYPFRGTNLRKLCIQEKIFDPKIENRIRLKNYYQGSILNFPEDFKRKLSRYKFSVSHYFKIFFQFAPNLYPVLAKILTKPIIPVNFILNRCRLWTQFERVNRVFEIKKTYQHKINYIIFRLFSLFLMIILFPFISKKE